MNSIIRTFFISIACLLLPAQILAQVKTFEEVVGHQIGDRITLSHQIVDYLNYLDEASDRVTLQEIGTTYDHRLQVAAILTAPENHERIDEIRSNAQLLNDPRRTNSDDAEQIISNQPAILYLGGSIHGFELSGTEGVLKTLEFFTTNNDPETLEQLRNTVMIADPVINSDGRDAFAQFNHQHRGRDANSDLADWSNDFTGWDGLKYRTSHYYFDLNRDWFAHTHPETRNRAALLQEWRPQAGVDAHEMGSEREFYVDPPTGPFSPFFPEYATNWFEEYGRAHAEAFDREHVEYTKREIFNFFYPAYFTSYMTYQGAVGMLYEQGSSRGFAWELSDGTVRTLSQAAHQQYTAFRAMVKLSSDRRADLLNDYYRANRDAIDMGSQGTVRYLINQEGDPLMVAEVVNLLMRSGIEVHRLTEDQSLRNVLDREGNEIGSHTFVAGTFLIEASQPRMAFIRKLMEPHIQIPEEFLEEARERVERSENPRFYDITSWSLPLLYNLQGFSTSHGTSLSAERVTEPIGNPGGMTGDRAEYAYLINGNQTALMSAIIPLRENGVRLHIIYKPTRINGTDYSSGTLVVRTDGRNEEVHGLLSELSEKYQLSVDAVNSGRADVGYPPLGTVEGNRIKKPKIAMLGNYPVQGYSFGWAWHTLDREYEIPHTIINPTAIASTPMERFDTLILPEIPNSSEMVRYMGEAGIERLQRWVNDGGTLVTIGSATDFARNNLELGNLTTWYDDDENEGAQRVQVPGAFVRTELDENEWIVSGYDYELPILINSNRLYRAPEGPPSPRQRTPVKVASGDDVRIAGHMWEENLERLPGSVFLYEERVGSGRVISFAEDVNFRGYWRGADRLFLNAVILGPSAP
ncbi:MAG: hypothetical protein JJU46_06815 [Balneolaceae bacterium]|nr:hypothetical protein [Balneolaceae bacterium]MCH8548254.1 M14 family metallopeptidase [Balneolaceae bacterium]